MASVVVPPANVGANRVSLNLSNVQSSLEWPVGECGTCLGPALTHRDAVAPDLERVLNLGTPDNDGPARVTALPYTPSAAEVVAALRAPLNNMQKALHEAAAHLPSLGPLQRAQTTFDQIEAHIENLVKGILPAVPNHQTPADTLPFIKQQLTKFRGATS